MAPAQSKLVVEETIPSSDQLEATAFPLMRLPSEIRLLILEKLLQNMRYKLDFKYHLADCPVLDDEWDGMELCDCPLQLDERLSVKLPIGIFQTCKQLRHDAFDVLQRKTCLHLEFPEKEPDFQAQEFMNHVHPLLVQNVSKIRVDLCLVFLNFRDLLDIFPCLDTVLSIDDQDRIDFGDPYPVDRAKISDPVIIAKQSKNPSSNDYVLTRSLWPAPGFKFLFERGTDLQNPAEGFKFKLLAKPDDLQRPVKFLQTVNCTIGYHYLRERYRFHAKVDVFSGACVARPGFAPDFENIEEWLEDFQV